MKPHTPDVDRLKPMYEQIKDLELGLLLSGLTILVKDTATYLTTHGINDDTAEGFRLAYLGMLSDNRYYWEHFGPDLYRTLRDAGLPQGFASGVSECNLDLQPLTEIDPEKEWLRAPGWHFFQTYSGQRRSDILDDMTLEELKASFFGAKKVSFCDPKDPYKPIAELVGRLAGTDRLFRAYWYPVMLYLAILLQKTHFTTLE